LLHGKMACGVRGDDLIVRVAADTADAALAEPGTRPFDLTGRPMKGWLLVDADGHAEDGDLRRWVDGAWPTPAPCRPSSHASHPSRACAEYRPGGVEAMATIGLWLGAVGRGWSVGVPGRSTPVVRLRP
jgi:hypothetical protein